MPKSHQTVNMFNIKCVVYGCKTSLYNKGPGVMFHECPASCEMRNKWLQILKNKCVTLDWTKSKICSKHFENKYFDSQRKLKENALPTLFLDVTLQENPLPIKPKTRTDLLLNNMTESELLIDIRSTLKTIKEPLNLSNFITGNLNCKQIAPQEAKLWLLIKKQQLLITKQLDQISKSKNQIEVLQKISDEATTAKKEMEQNIETFKYIVKSLQEKHATLEEQIEILSAVESR